MTEIKAPTDFNKVLTGIHKLKAEGGMNWMDAILEYCEMENYRIEDMGFLLTENKNFLKIIESDFTKQKYLRGSVKTTDSTLDDWS